MGKIVVQFLVVMFSVVIAPMAMATQSKCGGDMENAKDQWSESHQEWDNSDFVEHYGMTHNWHPTESPWERELRRAAQIKALYTGGEFAFRHHKPALHLDAFYDVLEASYFVHRPPGHLLPWALGKSEFQALRTELGQDGFWLLFRSYSFPKLGFPDVAVPHMSLMIDERVYEIGRPLVNINGVRVVSKMQPSGPMAIPLEDYMYKASLSEKELNAKPGLFFGVWIPHVSQASLKYLSTYFEGRAEQFSKDKKFNYNVSPDSKDCDNCVTYLTKPLVELQKAPHGERLGINGFFKTPGAMLAQYDHYFDRSLEWDRERAPMFMFVDDDWLKQTEAQYPRLEGSRPLPLLMSGQHPQFRGLFLKQNSGP